MQNYLKIECLACQKVTWYPDIDKNNKIFCKNCNSIVLTYTPCLGFIYILSNPSYGSLLKLGQTFRTIEERIIELNSATGVPNNFILEAYFLSGNPLGDETLLHKEFSKNRININREFFEIDVLHALKISSKLFSQEPILVSERAISVYKEDISEQDKIATKNASIQTKIIKLNEQKDYYFKTGNIEEVRKIELVLNRIMQR